MYSEEQKKNNLHNYHNKKEAHMAKECSICGKKLGFLAGKVTVSDGIVCDSCWFAAGLDLSINSMMTSNTRTVN